MNKNNPIQLFIELQNEILIKLRSRIYRFYFMRRLKSDRVINYADYFIRYYLPINLYHQVSFANQLFSSINDYYPINTIIRPGRLNTPQSRYNVKIKKLQNGIISLYLINDQYNLKLFREKEINCISDLFKFDIKDKYSEKLEKKLLNFFGDVDHLQNIILGIRNSR